MHSWKLQKLQNLVQSTIIVLLTRRFEIRSPARDFLQAIFRLSKPVQKMNSLLISPHEFCLRAPPPPIHFHIPSEKKVARQSLHHSFTDINRTNDCACMHSSCTACTHEFEPVTENGLSQSHCHDTSDIHVHKRIPKFESPAAVEASAGPREGRHLQTSEKRWVSSGNPDFEHKFQSHQTQTTIGKILVFSVLRSSWLSFAVALVSLTREGEAGWRADSRT